GPASFRGAPLGASPESIVLQRPLRDGFRARDLVAPRNDGRWRRIGYPPLNSPKKPVHGWPAVRIALIRRATVLSTRVNPTDGLRFSGDAARYAVGGAHP